MSWSFQIRNGDLNFDGPGGFATVTGTQKLLQDIKCALLTPQGTDPSHPGFGSIVQGGITADGVEVPTMIGSLVTPELRLDLESEIRRILHTIQAQQLDRLTRESVIYGGRNTFSQGEILASVDNVVINQVGDTLLVRIVFTTGNGDQVTLTQPLS